MKPIFRSLVLCGIAILYQAFFAYSQFPPPAGQPGSTAIYKDSSILINWAKTCETSLGYLNIIDTTIEDAGSNKANFGKPVDALGIADDHLVSLGDGGSAVLGFDPPVSDGTGFDFAVFENGLNDTFLELAFVEVSSDGSRFIRFPSTSLTPEDPQVGTFGSLDTRKINNLAGKYRVMFGTPFDLEELKDSSGLDIMHVTHVKIIDVVGCMTPGYESFDAYGHRINDPWPTNFYTCGFDLDAVGVIHESAQSAPDKYYPEVKLAPNPCTDKLWIEIPAGMRTVFQLYDLSGKIIITENISGTALIDVTDLSPGIYFGGFIIGQAPLFFKKIVRL